MAADVQIRFKSDSQQAQRDIQALQKEIADLRASLGQSERAADAAAQGVQQLGGQSRQTRTSVDVLESQMNAVRRETLDYRTSLSRLNAELAENRKALLTADAAAKETIETRNKQIRAEQGLLRSRQQSSSLLLSSLQQEKRELGGVSGALGQASGGTSILNRAAGELAGTLGAIGIIEVAFGIQRFGAASLEAAGEMQGMIRGLEDAYGSTERATARFSEFVELAKNPGLGIQQLTTYDAIFKNIGGTAKENNVIFTGLAKGITTYGGTLHDVTGALHQLQQAMGGNRIVAQDFRPILERTRGTFLTTAQEVHGFTGGIDEMRASWQASGQTLKQFLLPIFERMNERFEGAPVDAYTNKIGNLEDAFGLLQAAIGKKLLPVFNPLADGLLNVIEFVTEAAEKTDALKTAFDGLAQEIEKGTTTALESFIESLDAAIKKNEEYLQSDSIWKAYKKDVQEAQDELIRVRELITDATKIDATPESIRSLKQAAAEANQAYQQQISNVVALVDKYNELGQKGYENLQEWKDANEALEKARSTSQGLSKALEQVQKESQTASHSVSETATAATQPVKEAQKVMYNYGLEIAQATGEVEKWKRSLSDASSIQEIQKASEGLEAAQEKLNALEKKNAEQTKDRLKIYRSERQAQQAVAENAERIAKKQEALQKTEDEARQRSTDARIERARKAREVEVQAHKDAAAEGKDYADQLKAIADRKIRQAFVEMVDTFRDQGDSLDEARDKAERYLSVMEQVAAQQGKIIQSRLSDPRNTDNANTVANAFGGIVDIGRIVSDRIPEIGGVRDATQRELQAFEGLRNPLAENPSLQQLLANQEVLELLGLSAEKTTKSVDKTITKTDAMVLAFDGLADVIAGTTTDIGAMGEALLQVNPASFTNPATAIAEGVKFAANFIVGVVNENREREAERRKAREEQEARGMERRAIYDRGSAELGDFRQSFSRMNLEALGVQEEVEAYLEQVRTAIIAGANIDWDEVSEVVTGIISGPVSEARAAIDTAVEDIDFLIRQDRSEGEINTAVQAAIATITTNIATLIDANEDVTGEVEKLNALRLLDTTQSQGSLYRRGKQIRDNAPSNDDHLSYDELVAEYGQTEADIVMKQRQETPAGRKAAKNQEKAKAVAERLSDGQRDRAIRTATDTLNDMIKARDSVDKLLEYINTELVPLWGQEYDDMIQDLVDQGYTLEQAQSIIKVEHGTTEEYTGNKISAIMTPITEKNEEVAKQVAERISDGRRGRAIRTATDTLNDMIKAGDSVADLLVHINTILVPLWGQEYEDMVQDLMDQDYTLEDAKVIVEAEYGTKEEYTGGKTSEITDPITEKNADTAKQVAERVSDSQRGRAIRTATDTLNDMIKAGDSVDNLLVYINTELVPLWGQEYDDMIQDLVDQGYTLEQAKSIVKAAHGTRQEYTAGETSAIIYPITEKNEQTAKQVAERISDGRRGRAIRTATDTLNDMIQAGDSVTDLLSYINTTLVPLWGQEYEDMVQDLVDQGHTLEDAQSIVEAKHGTKEEYTGGKTSAIITSIAEKNEEKAKAVEEIVSDNKLAGEIRAANDGLQDLIKVGASISDLQSYITNQLVPLWKRQYQNMIQDLVDQGYTLEQAKRIVKSEHGTEAKFIETNTSSIITSITESNEEKAKNVAERVSDSRRGRAIRTATDTLNDMIKAGDSVDNLLVYINTELVPLWGQEYDDMIQDLVDQGYTLEQAKSLVEAKHGTKEEYTGGETSTIMDSIIESNKTIAEGIDEQISDHGRGEAIRTATEQMNKMLSGFASIDDFLAWWNTEMLPLWQAEYDDLFDDLVTNGNWSMDQFERRYGTKNQFTTGKLNIDETAFAQRGAQTRSNLAQNRVNRAQFNLGGATSESDFERRRGLWIDAINAYYDAEEQRIDGLKLNETELQDRREDNKLAREQALRQATDATNRFADERIKAEERVQEEREKLQDDLIDSEQKTQDKITEIHKKAQQDREDIQREFSRDIEDILRQAGAEETFFTHGDFQEAVRLAGVPDSSYLDDFLSQRGIELSDDQLAEVRDLGIQRRRDHEDVDRRAATAEQDAINEGEAIALAIRDALEPLLMQNTATAEKQATTADKEATTADKASKTTEKEATTADKASTTAEKQATTAEIYKQAINAFQESVPTFAIGAATLKDGADALKNIDRLISVVEDIPRAIYGLRTTLTELPERLDDALKSTLQSIETRIAHTVAVETLAISTPKRMGSLSPLSGPEPDTRLFHFPSTDAIARRVARLEAGRQRQRETPNYLPSQEQLRNAHDISREIMAGITEAQQRGDGGLRTQGPTEIRIQPNDIILNEEVIGTVIDEVLVRLDEDGLSYQDTSD